MCFRPTDANYSTIVCPNCGALNPGNATACWKCETSAEDMIAAISSDMDAPAAPKAPSSVVGNAPGAPAVPKVPGAPSL